MSILPPPTCQSTSAVTLKASSNKSSVLHKKERDSNLEF